MHRTRQTGQAIVLAPSGLGVFPQGAENTDPSRTEGDAPTVLKMSQFGRRYIIMKTRARVTKDGARRFLLFLLKRARSLRAKRRHLNPRNQRMRNLNNLIAYLTY
jgi:hypothetical protein